MKKLFVTAAIFTGLSPAFAGESTIKVPDNFPITMQQTQAAFERCLGAVVAHTATEQCQAVANVLAQLAALQPVPVPSPTPTPIPSPSGEPAKAPTPSTTP